MHLHEVAAKKLSLSTLGAITLFLTVFYFYFTTPEDSSTAPAETNS
ncbi:hypothetical protein [Alicyclobacillus fodiniaquatilis]|jgi:hypothetical protein|uniref:Uncharacterized protein n=1 Tax=Alicyclobacillus fodiniaquatilis TaxID=1661150 RepID=A0ABW4JPB1_9BACL